MIRLLAEIIVWLPVASGAVLFTVNALPFNCKLPCEMVSAGSVPSVVRMIGCEPKLTVAPPLRVAARPAPAAFKVVLPLKLKVVMADTSNVAPAAMLMFGVLETEPVAPSAKVPALMVVAPL